MKVYQVIAQRLGAINNCKASRNGEWLRKHTDVIMEILKDSPSGSGIDSGTTFDFEGSIPNRLVFTIGYHHMDEGGGYDGWTEHSVIVTPDLAFGFCLRITGRDRGSIKDYLTEVYQEWLSREADCPNTADCNICETCKRCCYHGVSCVGVIGESK